MDDCTVDPRMIETCKVKNCHCYEGPQRIVSLTSSAEQHGTSYFIKDHCYKLQPENVQRSPLEANASYHDDIYQQ